MTKNRLLSGFTALALVLSAPAFAGEDSRMPAPDHSDTPLLTEPGKTEQGVQVESPAIGSDEMAETMQPTTLQYVVEKGDTLSAIAKQTLGDESKWIVIARANDIEDPAKLAVGSRLQIPTRAGDRVAAEAMKPAAPATETTAPKPTTELR